MAQPLMMLPLKQHKVMDHPMVVIITITVATPIMVATPVMVTIRAITMVVTNMDTTTG